MDVMFLLSRNVFESRDFIYISSESQSDWQSESKKSEMAGGSGRFDARFEMALFLVEDRDLLLKRCIFELRIYL